MNNNQIPVLNVGTVPVGPGSQDEGDMVLDYMKMPGAMNTYDMPVLPESDDIKACPQAVLVLEQLQQALDHYREDSRHPVIPVRTLPAADLQLLNNLLGEGEVSIRIEGTESLTIQETVMAGVWRVRSHIGDELISDHLEVAAIPAAVQAMAFSHAEPLAPKLPSLPANLLNAPSVLVEINDISTKYTRGECHDAHVINLSLLPFSPEDHGCLTQVTGTGPVTILSRGYGNCRITATNVDCLWRVQYFNSTDQLILDTLEIVDIPAVACAAPEDLADSAERLTEIRDVLV